MTKKHEEPKTAVQPVVAYSTGQIDTSVEGSHFTEQLERTIAHHNEQASAE